MMSVWAGRELTAGTTCAHVFIQCWWSVVPTLVVVRVIFTLEFTFDRGIGRSADAVRHLIIK